MASGVSRTIRSNQESAPSRVRRPHQVEAGGRVLRMFDDDVLQEVTETCFDGPFVTRIDLEVVRDGAALIHGAVGLNEDGASGIGVFGTGRVELFERSEARFSG